MSGTRSSFAHLIRLAVLGALLFSFPVTAQAQFQGAIDTPTASSTVNSPFSISGWATWQNTGSGPGVDLVLIHGCLVSNCSTMSFWGAATYGIARPDVATALGHSRYTNSGFTLTKAGLSSGTYYVAMAVRDTATGAWTTPAALTVTFTATAVPEHTLETPVHGQALTSPVSVQGWALDASAPSGTGVSAVSLWAHPNPGSGQAGIWIGYATYGANRADVAASHGERFRYAGYTASTSALATGANLFGISAQSSHTQAWTSRIVTVYVDTPTVPLTIDRPGTGTGGVTASGLTCVGGSTTQAVPCGASYPLHTGVTLTAVPDANSTFAGWSGACTGTGTCQVTLSMARFVTATFTKRPDTIDTRYYHMDVVGSVRAITDAAGNLVTTAGAPSGRHDYRPFGGNTNPMTGDPIRFAGKELDPETGQQYFDARYYRNTWGRFSTVDPMHVEAAMTDPQQWNRYAHARNNPLAYGDPTGEFVIDFFNQSPGGDDAAGGGSVGSASAGLVAAFFTEIGNGIRWLFGSGGNNPYKSKKPEAPRPGPTLVSLGQLPSPSSPPGPGVPPNPSPDPDPDPGPGPASPPPPPPPSGAPPLPPCSDPFCEVARGVWGRTQGLNDWHNYAAFYGMSIAGGVGTGAGLTRGALLFARQSGWLNRGDVIRIGYGWNNKIKSEVFRIAIGSGRGGRKHPHWDLWRRP